MEQSTPKTDIIIASSPFNGEASVAAIIATIGRIITELYKEVVRAWEEGDRDYNRGARLRALQCRRQWKHADRPRLLALGISSQLIERRIGAKRLGRPVVSGHKPLGDALGALFLEILALSDEKTKPHERLWILRRLPMWPYFVEALYRGERENAKAKRLREPATAAENIVGDVLNMSPEAVHKVCGGVRRDRKKRATLPDCRAMTVAEFEVWKQTGQFQDDPFPADEKLLPRLLVGVIAESSQKRTLRSVA